ncbi:MAG: helix-turn-helix transcriptional regulator [Bacteroidales bacterium]
MNSILHKPYADSFFLFLLATLFSFEISAQEIVGIPIIRNYSKNEYKASTQNWSICQGSEGYMYFGNNQGVLQYTGYDWQLVEMSNYSIVRCVISCGKDSILVGAFNELGLLSHDNTGKPIFHSWNDKIPNEYRNYGEIWRIHKYGNFIYFQSFKSILIFENNTFLKAIVSDNEYRFSYQIDSSFYVYERNKGLLRLNNNTITVVEGGDFFKDKEIWSLFKLNYDQLLIGTQYNGFFTLQNGKIKPWKTQANSFILKHTLFNGVKLSNNQFAFGSVLNGLIITDETGKIKFTLNKQNGLQNNTILSLHVDNLNNIWLGLDNGIDYVKINSPLSFVRKNGGFGTGYSSIIFHNYLYAGTNQGLFRLNLNESANSAIEQNDFSLVPYTAGQVWGLFNLNGNLLCGHNLGLYLINDKEVKHIFDSSGVWDIAPIPNETDLFIMGTYYGFYLLKETKNNFSIVYKIGGLDESARRFFFDNKGFIWMSHGYKGIYQLKLSLDYRTIKTIKLHNSTNDLPMDYNNDAVIIKNHIYATTEKGIYEFDYESNKFTYDPKWKTFFDGNASRFTRLIESNSKKIWAFKRGSIQLLTYLNNKIYDLNARSFLLINNTLSGNYENVLALDNNQYLLGTEDGFVLYSDNETPTEAEKIPLSIAWIETHKSNSQFDLNERIPILNVRKNDLGEIPFGKRHISIVLSMPFFSSQDLVKFRYRINNGNWSKWLNGNTVDLNDLIDDHYFVNIECSIDEKEVSGTTSVSFTIKPPIHRTWYAYMVYILIFSGMLFSSYLIIKTRIEREKRRTYLAQKKKMIRQEVKLKKKAQETENELNILKNEKLQSDIIHKSKELANTTMDIIQKNIVLGDIKETLQELVHENPSLRNSNKISHLIRKINKGIEQKDKWVVFEKNFDEVHENFLHKLKDRHPNLTSKDMRLAAYLRMNLSSKEIAPLMNISIRSVEISRYRLRKKINIEHDKNLYDYLISL